jgi:outer membrane protein OmpA-like peptidoglycan-associated protein
MTNTALHIEINSLPKELRAEVADFVEFLKKKSKVKSGLKAREFGFAKDKIKLSADFDEPLDEFNEYMWGKGDVKAEFKV